MNAQQTRKVTQEILETLKNRPDVAELLSIVNKFPEGERKIVITFLLDAITTGALHDPGKMEELALAAEEALRNCAENKDDRASRPEFARATCGAEA